MEKSLWGANTLCSLSTAWSECPCWSLSPTTSKSPLDVNVVADWCMCLTRLQSRGWWHTSRNVKSSCLKPNHNIYTKPIYVYLVPKPNQTTMYTQLEPSFVNCLRQKCVAPGTILLSFAEATDNKMAPDVLAKVCSCNWHLLHRGALSTNTSVGRIRGWQTYMVFLAWRTCWKQHMKAAH